MIKKIINRVLGKKVLYEILKSNQELEWAHIYHDSIKGKPWLADLPLNVGRWAGNYSFLYVLNRILTDCRPKEILEFGLGESSKIISKYIENYLTESNHDIIEQDMEWLNHFNDRFKLSHKSSVQILPLVKKQVKGYETNSYENIENFISKKYDFYLIDGPFGSLHYSRYDIVNIAKDLNQDDEFVILLDDYNRIGEKETFMDLLKILERNKIRVYTHIYEGTKSLSIIGTEKYKFISSL